MWRCGGGNTSPTAFELLIYKESGKNAAGEVRAQRIAPAPMDGAEATGRPGRRVRLEAGRQPAGVAKTGRQDPGADTCDCDGTRFIPRARRWPRASHQGRQSGPGVGPAIELGDHASTTHCAGPLLRGLRPQGGADGCLARPRCPPRALPPGARMVCSAAAPARQAALPDARVLRGLRLSRPSRVRSSPSPSHCVCRPQASRWRRPSGSQLLCDLWRSARSRTSSRWPRSTGRSSCA